MVQYPVPNECLVDVSLFGVSNVKISIWSMLVDFVFQLSAQCKNVLLQIPLELQNIFLFVFISAKSFPSNEKALGRNYQIVNMFKCSHG